MNALNHELRLLGAPGIGAGFAPEADFLDGALPATGPGARDLPTCRAADGLTTTPARK